MNWTSLLVCLVLSKKVYKYSKLVEVLARYFNQKSSIET